MKAKASEHVHLWTEGLTAPQGIANRKAEANSGILILESGSDAD
jgi:hypothetical protein